MRTSIAVTALTGGVGASTLCVEYSLYAAQRFDQVYVFDLSRKSAVDFIFKSIGGDRLISSTDPQLVTDMPARRTMANIHSIPLGQIKDYECLSDGADFVQKDSVMDDGLWIKKPQGSSLQIFDAPVESSITQEAWRVSELIVVPLRCDAHSYGQLLRLLERAGKELEDKLRFVINHYDSARMLGNDVAALMRERLGSRLCPHFIHEDESVREAIACKQTIQSYAPDAQAAHDVEMSFRWLMEGLGGAAS